MFTGLVEEVGEIQGLQKESKSMKIQISISVIGDDLKIGDSVAVNGICLTVVEVRKGAFLAEVMNETLCKSTIGNLTKGEKVNLERAMPLGGRFGGHIVSGHIDGVGKVQKKTRVGNAMIFTINVGEELRKGIVKKGSVAIDGVSLTVATVDQETFEVSLIPHTYQATTLCGKSVGDLVNIEIDMIGKYVACYMEQQRDEKVKKDKISKEFLMNHGFF